MIANVIRWMNARGTRPLCAHVAGLIIHAALVHFAPRCWIDGADADEHFVHLSASSVIIQVSLLGYELVAAYNSH